MGGTSANPLTKGLVPDIPKPPSSGITKEQLEEAKEKGGVFGEFARSGGLNQFLLPELPDMGATERARQRALIERTIAAAFTGTGRKATIATSPRGVTTPAPTRRRTLTPTERTVRRRITS
jgi:hypothetical protein